MLEFGIVKQWDAGPTQHSNAYVHVMLLDTHEDTALLAWDRVVQERL